jgi:predicted CopG family antitoxin
MSKERITVSLHRDTYNELRKFGYAAESFDNVISRMMSQCKERKRMAVGDSSNLTN